MSFASSSTKGYVELVNCLEGGCSTTCIMICSVLEVSSCASSSLKLNGTKGKVKVKSGLGIRLVLRMEVLKCHFLGFSKGCLDIITIQ